MDVDYRSSQIESSLDRVESMELENDEAAREALSRVMVTVGDIDQLSAYARAEATVAAAEPVEGIIERLKKWLDRLINILTKIVEKLANATSFSISVGINVSVTVNFGPFGGNTT